jgi:tetratricopeptide (TPR) repeat protein
LEENNGSVLRDCSKALSINHRSSKAFYRSALALIALERLEEALDCCDRCLSFDPDNKGVQSVRHKAREAKAAMDQRQKERLERIKRERNAEQLLQAAFKVRS